MSKIRSLAAAAAARESNEHMHNALMCLVKAAPGRAVRIPHGALKELRAGDGVEVTVDGEGMTLRFLNVNDPSDEPRTA